MAERYPEVPLPLPMDPIEARINGKFNKLTVYKQTNKYNESLGLEKVNFGC